MATATAPIVAFLKAFFRALSRRKETPEDAIQRGFRRSYPGWVKDGILKKPQ